MVQAIEPHHPLIALDNAAACFLTADLPAVGDTGKPWAWKGGCRTASPPTTPKAALNLAHVSDVGVREAVAVSMGLSSSKQVNWLSSQLSAGHASEVFIP